MNKHHAGLKAPMVLSLLGPAPRVERHVFVPICGHSKLRARVIRSNSTLGRGAALRLVDQYRSTSRHEWRAGNDLWATWDRGRE